MKIELLQTDITAVNVDAIVNAANRSLMGGGGVDGAIHRKGGPVILEECMRITNKHGGCDPGEAVYTTAGKLPATYVIHTVGPIWDGGSSGEDQLLRNCYLNSLKIAEKLGVKSISFPNISTGVYRFPKRRAAEIAVNAVKQYGETNTGIERVIFVCFDDENFRIYRDLIKATDSQIT
jgi:O-acetyl-ADP-ribose deacetylase (regulator of RNase III)